MLKNDTRKNGSAPWDMFLVLSQFNLQQLLSKKRGSYAEMLQ